MVDQWTLNDGLRQHAKHRSLLHLHGIVVVAFLDVLLFVMSEDSIEIYGSRDPLPVNENSSLDSHRVMRSSADALSDLLTALLLWFACAC